MPTKTTSPSEKPLRGKLKSSVLPTRNSKSTKSPELAPMPSDVESTSFATSLDPQDRERMIRETAYYLAEKDGFQEGRESYYWQQAEEQIDKMLQQ